MIETLEKWLIAFNRGSVTVILTVMFCLVFAQVLARYLFSVSFAWIDEVVGFLMIWLTYAGAGLALREGRLVGFDLLQKKLPAKLEYLLRFFIGLAILVFMSALVYWGIRFALFGLHKETNVLQISRAIPYAGIPVGAFILSLHLLVFFKKFISEEWDAETPLGTNELNLDLMED